MLQDIFMFVHVLILQSYNISGMLGTAPRPPDQAEGSPGEGEDICLREDFLWQ